MDSKNEIENEIKYWTTHQDLDKFNISKDTSLYIGHMSWFTTIFIGVAGLAIGLISLTILFVGNWVTNFPIYLKIVILGILIVLIFIGGYKTFIYISNRRKEWNTTIRGHNISFIAREEMIKKRYEKLGVSKEKLDEEFESIKKIIEENYNNSEYIKVLVEDYYRDGK